jgi:hypothetical protein
VVDVERGVVAEPRVDEVDEGLERDPLLVAIPGPERAEAVGVEDAPEVLEAAEPIPEGVALEVEEDVPREGGGRSANPDSGAGRISS